MFTFQNIYKAYTQCRKNKTNTINALKFEQNILENLWELYNMLNAKQYTIGKSLCFLTSSPKLRKTKRQNESCRDKSIFICASFICGACKARK
jgi:hypothetical protein